MVLASPLLMLGRFARAADAPVEAGKVQIIDGQVRVRSAAGAEHQPAVGGQLFEGDTIVTGADGELHAEMVDGGVIGLRPQTTLTLSKYRATGETTDGAIFQLLRGGFRSVTGWIAKSAPSNYRITSGTATIGVRGTDHEPHVIEAGSSEGEPGLYDRVHEGGTFIEGPQGRVDVQQGKVGFFSPTARAAPRLLEGTPSFFRPGRHEDRFQGLNQRVSRGLEARRATRIQQLREGGRQLRAGEKRTSLLQNRENRTELRAQRSSERGQEARRGEATPMERWREAHEGEGSGSRSRLGEGLARRKR